MENGRCVYLFTMPYNVFTGFSGGFMGDLVFNGGASRASVAYVQILT